MTTNEIRNQVRNITCGQWIERAEKWAETYAWLKSFPTTTQKTLNEYRKLCASALNLAAHKN